MNRILMSVKRLFKKKNKFEIIERSNVIQYDDIGYPLRLCIVKNGKKIDQMWIDTNEQAGDIVLKWIK